MKNGSKKYGALSFCPGCMKTLLSPAATKAFGRAIAAEDTEAIKALMEHSVAGFDVFIPDTEETALLVEDRALVYPLCHGCCARRDNPKFKALVAKNIGWTYRVLPRRKRGK